MNRLTHARSSGIKSGYWSPNKKEELVQRLAAYEDTGLSPEQIVEMDELYAEKCKDLESERRKHRWIPVEERLPDTYDYVIVTEQNGFVSAAWYSNTCGLWTDMADMADDDYDESSIDVLAWMPMPEAYQPEGRKS